MSNLSVEFARSQDFAADILNVQAITALPAILQSVCHTAGVGFAAVARVTQDRWVACAVRDDICLGVRPGDALQHANALSHTPLVLNDIVGNPLYNGHPTAGLYGFQSLLSMPIVLPNGHVWGSLCAMGSQPAELDASEILETVRGFADLIALRLGAGQRSTPNAAEGERQRYHLALEARLRGVSDPITMMQHAAATLGCHLGIDQVGFGEINEQQTHVIVARDWNAGRTASVAGTWRMDDFGPALFAQLRQGNTVALADVRTDPLTSSPDITASYEAINTRAVLDVPLVRAGRLLAMIFVHHSQPRHWTEVEISLVEETSARLWSAVESARAETRLRQSEERLRAIFASAAVGLSEVDLQGRFLRVNNELCRILGYSEQALLGMGVADVTHPEDLSASLTAVAQAISTGSSTSLDKRYTRPDSSLIWANSNIQRLDDHQGQLRNLLVVTVDLTARKVAEEALRASEEFNRRVLSSSADCIKVLDLDARLEFMSEGGMCTMEVDNFSDIEGACWPDLWHGEEHPKALAAVEEAKQGRFGRFQGFATTMKGTPRWWDVIVTPITGRDGRPEKLLSISRDVTATKQAEMQLRELNETLEDRVLERTTDLIQTQEALRQAQKMEAVGQLTGGLAHDFNNLLAGISGSLELMQTRIAQGRFTDVSRYMAAAQSAARRAAALTHRLLAFSRRQTLDPKPTDVNRLVKGLEEMIRRTVGPSIAIEVAEAQDLWSALVDPPQLENALLNLAINARDAMPDGGRITIETANTRIDRAEAREHNMVEGQYLSLRVSDSGTGMPPNVMARVFEPFFTTKPLGEGTGLGLSMIYGFAHQSGGHVRIASTVGEGTTVCIYLPRHHGPEDVEQGHATPIRTAPSEQGETVLVVDDEATVRMLVTDILEDLGYTAIEAADSRDGLKILQSDARIDLLVTDVGLPGGMNGRQMADAGREHRPALKVLFITGYAENAALGEGQLKPGMAVLTKPFPVDAMATRIRQMLEG